MRSIDYYTFNKKEDFLKVCTDQFYVLHNTYKYYFCNLCNKINDIEDLLKRKKDYYNHRCNIYYTNDECFFVSYRKNNIVVEVLLDCNGAQIAHKLTKDLEKLNIKEEEPDPVW